MLLMNKIINVTDRSIYDRHLYVIFYVFINMIILFHASKEFFEWKPSYLTKSKQQTNRLCIDYKIIITIHRKVILKLVR